MGKTIIFDGGGGNNVLRTFHAGTQEGPDADGFSTFTTIKDGDVTIIRYKNVEETRFAREVEKPVEGAAA